MLSPQPMMDTFLSFPSNAIAIATTTVAFLIFIYSLSWISRNILNEKKKAAPEAGGAWPIIGHLHLLGGPQPPHIVLGKMAYKYGPIFTIKMGMHRTLIVSNWEIAKECFTTNDRAFANRPKSLAAVILGYDRSIIGFSPYDNYWRQIRKIVTHELLSNHRVRMLKHVRESEITRVLKELYKLWENNNSNNSGMVLVEMKRWIGDLSLNLILRSVVGTSVGYVTTTNEEEEGIWKQAFRDYFHLSGLFVAADAVPFLRWLDIGGHEKAMKKTAERMDIVVTEWLMEHKEKKSSGCVKKGEEDFMDVLLDIIDDEAEATLSRDSDKIIKATCLALTVAASDTIAVSLIWALALLVNNLNVLKKAQQELDIHVGRERQVEESDINNLVYLKAIVKETLRLYPAGPLSGPHESMKDCTVAGYHIPTGTRLVTNLWKIHSDPKVWSNPSEYQPERFLTTHKDFEVIGKIFELIPFGSGRRMCPGVEFALQIMELTLATLLQGFDFATPNNEQTDMTESFGLTNLEVTPLEVLINPRLHSHLYQ